MNELENAPGAPSGDDLGPIEIAPIDGVATAQLAARALDDAEALVGVPLVDEAERRSLDRALADDRPDDGWRAVLARRNGEVVGYAGLRTPAEGRGPAVGDAAPFRVVGAWTHVLPGLLDALDRLAGPDGPERPQVWVRHVTVTDLDTVVAGGVALERRLGILGRRLDRAVEVPAPAEGTTIRAYRPDEDDEDVVGVLASAYEGTGDGGWDLTRFRDRRALPWFRAEDLLVAAGADGRLRGLHWLKRRDATTGEVYNLAVHPRAQGERLGPALLGAGLEHLRTIGCDDVLLWVDLSNERAVRLYRAQGFATRWEDVALRLGGETSERGG